MPLQTEFIDLRNDRTLQLKFNDVPLNTFWIDIAAEYPQLSKKAIDILLQFSTSWMCEHGFSTLATMKTKKRQRMLESTLEDDMRVCLSQLPPRIPEICRKHQGQISH
ncbi:hypothetical protein GE061_007371 [Apolygus lucorum]|uniref:HAT C-terminal dimerisation domain-containing protein n=1 Tax=Apolygus lucorum TaxID=248454 RepID=A0A6A4IX21_APOLU|nr:hypothetical protein GE061_007371 [Apolygus lucorum]